MVNDLICRIFVCCIAMEMKASNDKCDKKSPSAQYEIDRMSVEARLLIAKPSVRGITRKVPQLVQTVIPEPFRLYKGNAKGVLVNRHLCCWSWQHLYNWQQKVLLVSCTPSLSFWDYRVVQVLTRPEWCHLCEWSRLRSWYGHGRLGTFQCFKSSAQQWTKFRQRHKYRPKLRHEVWNSDGGHAYPP